MTVDDASVFLAKFTGGAIGTFEATRLAPGRKNYNRFEINGAKGTLAWCFEDLNYLDYYSTERPRRPPRVPPHHRHRRRAPVRGNWWPPGHMLGYDHALRERRGRPGRVHRRATRTAARASCAGRSAWRCSRRSISRSRAANGRRWRRLSKMSETAAKCLVSSLPIGSQQCCGSR